MFTASSSASIDYRERPGSGPALVLLHGIGSHAESFAGLVPLLPADWRVIAWNAPGYGGSEPFAEEWPVAADPTYDVDHFVRSMRPYFPRVQIRPSSPEPRLMLRFDRT